MEDKNVTVAGKEFTRATKQNRRDADVKDCCSQTMSDAGNDKNVDDNFDRSSKTWNKSAWDCFASKTSLHGMTHVQEKDRGPGSRIIWCVLVIGMVCVTFYMLVSLLLEYREYPIKSVWNLRRDSQVKIPAISLCLCSSFDSRKIANSTAAKYFNNYRNFSTKDPDVQKLFDRPYSEIFYNFGFSKEDIILDLFIYVNGVPKINATKYVKRYVESGKLCFSVNDVFEDVQPILPDISTDTFLEFLIALPKNQQGVSLSNEYLGKGVFLYLNDHGNIGNLNIPFLVSPGVATYVMFYWTQFNLLPQPYRSFGDDTCLENVNSKDFSNPLKRFPVYTFENCIMELYQNLSAEKCGCVLEKFAVMYADKNITECTHRQYYDCYVHLTTYKNSLLPLCPHPCDKLEVELTDSVMPFSDNHRKEYFTDKDNVDYIHLVLQAKTTNVEIIRHEPEITVSSIWGTIGGFLGLFIGASVLTLAEFLEFLITATKRSVSRLIRG